MNKSDLKNFAINARLALLQRVADRAALYGIDEEKCQSRAIVPSSSFHMLDGSVLSAQEVGQRNALIARISKIGYRQTMEEAAYTWFNRLIAIRYMQQHSLLPVSMRVLPEAPGALPQILREAQDVSLPGVEPDQVLAMLDANRTDALYRYLLIALCNALGGCFSPPPCSRPIPSWAKWRAWATTAGRKSRSSAGCISITTPSSRMKPLSCSRKI